MGATGAVIVTHHPDASVAENLAAIAQQAAPVVVVDNGSAPAAVAALRQAAGASVEFICNPKNVGIATALNQGMTRAAEQGCEWVATFDQDSRVQPGFVAALSDSVAAHPYAARVAIAAPVYRDVELGHLWSASGARVTRQMKPRLVSVAATSGNLLRVSAWRQVGEFRGDLFIDCVDFEFCLRARQRGWLVLEAPAIVLDHALGKASRRRWWGGAAVVNDYPAGRRYYQTRNRLVMYGRFAAFDPRWVASDAFRYAKDLMKLGLFGEHRASKLGAAAAGAWDALSGRRGPHGREEWT